MSPVPVPVPYRHPGKKYDRHHNYLEGSEDQFKQHRHSSEIDEESSHSDDNQKYPEHKFSFQIKSPHNHSGYEGSIDV
jgi:hypothetical protein